MLWAEKDAPLIVEHKVRFLPIILILMVIFLISAILKLKKKDGQAYRYFFGLKENFVAPQQESTKIVISILALVIVISLFVEIIRGMWLFVSLNWALFILILIYLKGFLENLRQTEVGRSEINSDNIPSLFDPKFFLKGIMFHGAIATIYTISLGSFIILFDKSN